MKRWILIIAIVVVGLTGLMAAGSFWGGELVVTAPVERASIHDYIDERGRTRLPRIHDIAMPDTGRLLPIQVNVGDRVKQGDVVAQIVPEDLELDVKEAEAVLNRLKASLVEHQNDDLEQHAYQQSQHMVDAMDKLVRTADARKTASAKGLAIVTAILERTRRLVEQNAGAEQDQERSELEYVESSVKYEQDALSADAMRLMDSAMKLVPVMVKDYITRRELTARTVARQTEEAAVQLDRAKLRQERGTMSSPVDGVVLDRQLDSEQLVTAGTTLLRIGRLDDLEIEAEVLTQDATRIQDGADVVVYGEAVGRDAENGWLASVHRVEPEGFTKVSSLGVEQQRVRVIMRFGEEARQHLKQLRLGVEFRVRTRIITEIHHDILRIPRTALFRGPQGQWQVFAVSNGRARLTEVEIGIINDEEAEVLSGLKDSDSVILAPNNEIADGSRVRTASTKN